MWSTAYFQKEFLKTSDDILFLDDETDDCKILHEYWNSCKIPGSSASLPKEMNVWRILMTSCRLIPKQMTVEFFKNSNRKSGRKRSWLYLYQSGPAFCWLHFSFFLPQFNVLFEQLLPLKTFEDLKRKLKNCNQLDWCKNETSFPFKWHFCPYGKANIWF